MKILVIQLLAFMTLIFSINSFAKNYKKSKAVILEVEVHKFGVDLSWNWDRVDVPFDNGEFTTSILSARFKYSFSPDLFAKAFIQWNDFEKKIISNFLLNFIHTPGSDFYLVYNEEWDTEGGINTLNRTVVAKLTHPFNL